MKAEVHKNLEGAFVLSQMQPEHDESSSQWSLTCQAHSNVVCVK
jgi:hypothetical protein